MSDFDAMNGQNNSSFTDIMKKHRKIVNEQTQW